MKPYVPEYVGTVTKYVFVDSPDTTPQDIATAAYEVAQVHLASEVKHRHLSIDVKIPTMVLLAIRQLFSDRKYK